MFLAASGEGRDLPRRPAAWAEQADSPGGPPGRSAWARDTQTSGEPVSNVAGSSPASSIHAVRVANNRDIQREETIDELRDSAYRSRAGNLCKREFATAVVSAVAPLHAYRPVPHESKELRNGMPEPRRNYYNAPVGTG